jgi:hypothetical protein
MRALEILGILVLGIADRVVLQSQAQAMMQRIDRVLRQARVTQNHQSTRMG